MIPGIILGLASTAFSFFGQRQQARAAEQAAEYNARVKENEAIREEQESREERRRIRMAGKKEIAKQRARIAKSGTAFEGTPLLALAESATNIELGIADEARASGIRQSHLLGQAEIGRFEGAAKATGHRYKAGAHLLSGATRLSGQIRRGI